VHTEQGNYDQALEAYRKSLEIFQRIGDQRGIADTLNNAANVRAERGDYEQALEGHRRCLEILQRIGDQRGMAMTLNNAATVHAERGDYEQALEGYRKSLELREKIGDQRGMAETLKNLGWAHEEHGDRDLALDCVERSLRIAREHGVVMMGLHAQLALAEIYLRMGELDKAQSLSDPALSESTRLNLKPIVSEAQRILGMVGRERKAWAESISCFEQTVETSRRMGGRLTEGKSRYEFGLMWKMKGDAAEAREQLDSAARIFQGLGLEHWLAKVERAREGL
jgi:tetratricopeptide (TPR) repeat protein